MVNQSSAIYWYQCGNLGCDEEYIGETSRTFHERYKETPEGSLTYYHHSSQTGHPTNHNNFQIIGMVLAETKEDVIENHLSDFDYMTYVGNWHDITIITGTVSLQ